jgi:hypothetical protein
MAVDVERPGGDRVGPEAGVPQSSLQNVQANSADFRFGGWWRLSLAFSQGPSSIRTSTRLIGAPQAAPMMAYWSPRRVTLAGADLSRSWFTVAKVQTVSPPRSSSRMVT